MAQHSHALIMTPPDNRSTQSQGLANDATENAVSDIDEPTEKTPRPIPVLPVAKQSIAALTRKESVLSKMFHSSEAESMDENSSAPAPRRGLSATSTWSNPSLTSDGMTSSDTRTNTPSPPLPATILHTSFPSVIFNQESFSLKPTATNDTHESIDPLHINLANDTVETTVEAGLGRKRRITFACGKKAEAKAENTAADKGKQASETAPVERKCALRFFCPSKTPVKETPAQTRRISDTRRPSPAPAQLKISPKASSRVRRASASTTGSSSPRSPKRATPVSQLRRFTADNIDTTPTERACGYAGQRAEDDDWMKERTCHRSKLTVDDTLKVEKNLRHLAEEAEEEEEDEIEAEEELDQEGLPDDIDNDDADEDDDEAEDAEEDADSDGFTTDFTAHVIDMSDDGFHSDDEGGMNDTSDESDAESEFSWWAPGRSTAATSYEQLDHLLFTRQRNMSGSSIGSISSVKAISGDRPDADTIRKTKKRRAIPIRQPHVELPDSTDFVCGTLDEDRPLEDAYIRQVQERRAAKHKTCPQDIDPTFPTSDPEMDEEDDEDIYVNHHESESERDGVFGQIEEHEEVATYTATRGRQRPNKSPALSPKRMHSPAPKRLHSPPPRRTAVHRSPPPQKLFGHSPRRIHSPPPTARLRSPLPSRRTSFTKPPHGAELKPLPTALAERPHGANLFSTSLPRRPNLLQRHRTFSPIPDVDYDSSEERAPRPARGAIDIVKGLEKKRQLRKEKLYQKMCRQRAAQNGTKKDEKRCQPGKGVERMREMGLELAGRWKGEKKHEYSGMGTDTNAQHILSL